MAEYIVEEPSDRSASWRVYERIVRCRDCRWSHDATPVDEWHLECRVRPLCRHYTPDDGFCHLGEPKVVDLTTNDVDAEVDA